MDALVRTWSEKRNEVNKDFKLRVHFVTLNIPLSLMEIITEITLSHYTEVKPKLYTVNLDIFVVDALYHFSCGMQFFNDSEECYNSYLNLTADLML